MMLTHELLRDKGLLLVRPQGPIQAGDFETIAKLVDPYIEQTGGLRGIMIEAPSFPGCDSFAAVLSHMKFVRNHHQLVAKIAAVSTVRSSLTPRKSPSISSRPSYATSPRRIVRLLLPGWAKNKSLKAMGLFETGRAQDKEGRLQWRNWRTAVSQIL
jgi:hypothetical protein